MGALVSIWKLAVRIVAVSSFLEPASAASLARFPAKTPPDKDHSRRMITIARVRTARGAQFVGDVGFVFGAKQRRLWLCRATSAMLDDLVS